MTTVIDSHLHLWQLDRPGYSWVTPELGPLYRSFGPDDIEPQLTAEHIDGVVLVQADDTSEDTRYMLSVAESRPWVKGVVGWVCLDDPSRAAAQLDDLEDNVAFRGVRHLVHTDPRAEFLEFPTVLESLRDLARRDLTFDVPDAWPRHLGQVTALAAKLPELRIVIDHLGKPPLGTDQFPAWRKALADAAAHPNVFAKVSGLSSVGAHNSAERLAPAWSVALEAFGPERLMWGSDWPMSIRVGGFAPALAVARELISELSSSEQERIYGATAAAFYSLAG